MSVLFAEVAWLDAECKTWANWVIRQRDGGLGWKRRSPLTNFGTVSGGGYGAGHSVWDASCEHMDQFDRWVKMLPGPSVRLLMLYYVQAGAVARRCGTMLGGKHPTQVTRDLVRVLKALALIVEGKRDEGIAKAKEV